MPEEPNPTRSLKDRLADGPALPKVEEYALTGYCSNCDEALWTDHTLVWCKTCPAEWSMNDAKQFSGFRGDAFVNPVPHYDDMPKKFLASAAPGTLEPCLPPHHKFAALAADSDQRDSAGAVPDTGPSRCRWCGSHGVNRLPDALNKCRARLEYGPCQKWEQGMVRWPQFIELDEYVHEVSGVVLLRPGALEARAQQNDNLNLANVSASKNWDPSKKRFLAQVPPDQRGQSERIEGPEPGYGYNASAIPGPLNMTETVAPPTDEELADHWIDEIPEDTGARLMVLYADGAFGELFAERLITRRPELKTTISLVILDPDPDTGIVGWRRVIDLLNEVYLRRLSLDPEHPVPATFSDFDILGHPERMKGEHAKDNLANVALAVHRSFASYRASVVTRKARAREFFANSMWNSTLLPGSVCLKSLLRVGGEPPFVVVIGGGPSHKDPGTLYRIREAQRNRAVLVVCCDRALPEVVDAGVMPDIVASIDINPEKHTILQDYGPRTPGAVLVSPMTVNFAITSAWRSHGNGMIAFAGTGQPEGEWLSPLPEISEPLSVGEFAIDIAGAMNPRGIALVGMEFTDKWKGEGAGRPMRIGGLVSVSIVFDAFIGSAEQCIANARCPVWNYGYPHGVALKGAQEPWFPIDALFGQRSHLPIEFYDFAELESKLQLLHDAPLKMLRHACADVVTDNLKGLDALTQEQRDEGLSFIEKNVAAALDVLRNDTEPEETK